MQAYTTYPDVEWKSLNFEDEISLRRVDCNNPTLINKGILIRDEYGDKLRSKQIITILYG
jgi:hypothetical protein